MKRLLSDIMSGTPRRDGEPPQCGPSMPRLEMPRRLKRKLSTDNLPFALLDNIDEVTRRVGEAQALVDRRFCRQDARAFLLQFRTLLCGKAIIDALHYPAQIDAGLGFQGDEWAPTAEDVVRASCNERHNYLIPYYRAEVLPGLTASEPGLVGLSATHLSELIPVFTLARMVKEILPDTHIVLGGAAISDIRERLAANECLWDWIDSIVYGPGELAFVELEQALERGAGLAKVPNLIFRKEGKAKESDRTAELDPNDYATPHYVNLRPGVSVALETSTGCYWGRCAFCYYPRQGNSRRGFQETPCRERSLDHVHEDMEILASRHQPSLIGITDSSLAPSRIEAIAEHNQSSGSGTPFSAFVRLEKEFEDPAFCRKLARGGFLGGQAGLETGTERVNGLINKGINLALVPKILRSFRKAGIMIHLYSLVGFPGEREDEAWETYNLIKRERRNLLLDWQVYPLRILENGPLAEKAAEWGLATRRLPQNMLVPLSVYETREGLGQTDANRLSVTMERKLSRYRHKMSRWMDVELYKSFLLKVKSDTWRAERRHRNPGTPDPVKPAWPAAILNTPGSLR